MTTDLNGLSVFIPDDAEAELPLICALGEDVSGINAIAGFMDCKAAIVALPVDDWNAELTPWPAPPLRRGKPFAGNADKMLERLDRLMSELPAMLKSNMGITVSKCLLIGYSLGGLCALWAATMRGCFDGVASISGSLWYDGFDEYIGEHAVNAHAVYLSLGDAEPRTRDKRLGRVGDSTLAVYDRLTKMDIRTVFEWNPGNHFADAPKRSARGADWLCKNV